MPHVSFTIGAANDYVIDINLSWWGQEKYYVNENLILRNWSFFGGKPRKIKVGQHIVTIVLSSTGRKGFLVVFL